MKPYWLKSAHLERRALTKNEKFFGFNLSITFLRLHFQAIGIVKDVHRVAAVFDRRKHGHGNGRCLCKPARIMTGGNNE